MAVGLYFVFSFLVLGILTVVLLKWLLKRWFRIEKTGGNFNREFYLLPKYGKLYTSSYEIIAPLIFTSRTLPSSVILLERIFALCSLANGAALLRLDFAFTRHVLVFKASIAKHVLMSREATVKSSQMYHFMKKWLGNALISSDHYKWIDVRKKLQPTLHKKVIESYFPIFYENSLTLASKLESLAGQKVDIIPILGSCTLDALVETSTGIKMGIQKNEYSEYLRSINTLTDFTLARIFKPWYWFDSIFNLFPEGKEYFKALKYSKDFSMKVIEERKRTLVASKTLDREQKYQRENESVGSKLRGISFLDMVLEMHLNDKTFTLLDVQEQVEGLLLGGYETSSLTMSYTLFLLGLDPTRLGKVQEELDAVLGTNPDYPVELERVKELSYLECVIKEASRLYPVAPFIARTLQSDLRIAATSTHEIWSP